MTDNQNPRLGAVDWILSSVLAGFAFIVFLCGLADYAYPGQSAQLLSALQGLEPLPEAKYPLFACVNGLLFPAGSQLLAPICGAVGVFILYHLARAFLSVRVIGEYVEKDARFIVRLGAAVSAAVFAFTPAVRLASTHLDPAVFDTVWAMLSFALLFVSSKLPRKAAWTVPVLVGVLSGLGVGDTILFLFLAPLYLMAAWRASRRCGGKGYGSATLFLLTFLLVALIAVPVSHGGFAAYFEGQKSVFRGAVQADGLFCLPLFAVVPFVVALFSSRSAFGGDRGWMQVAYHALMTLLSVLALSTQLSVSSVMAPVDYSPVLTCALAALTAGYLMAYWWSLTRVTKVANESLGTSADARRFKVVGQTAGGFLALVLALTTTFDFFFGFDSGKGRFADLLADRIVSDLGERTWFVTDGTLDSHLRLAAKRAGRELNLICLQKDDDRAYVERLAVLAEKKGLAPYVGRLRKLGILAFLGDWFGADPAVADKVAVFGAPDLWKYAPPLEGSRRRSAVPELLFFGGDERFVSDGKGQPRAFDFDAVREFVKALPADEGWDSYTLMKSTDYIDLMRLNLRRHVGFVACNWACREDGKARLAQSVGNLEGASAHFDRAFAIYDFVLKEIDAGNICALYNALDLVNSVQHANEAADDRSKELQSALDAIKGDEHRRYIFDRLPLVYGYIMNPTVLIKQGLAMVKNGRRETGLDAIARASELVAFDARRKIELELLAPFYSQERGSRKAMSREIYEQSKREFESNPQRIETNPEVLITLVRLALRNGDSSTATSYMETLESMVARKRLEPGLGYYSIQLEYNLSRGDLGKARTVVLAAQEMAPSDVRVWNWKAIVVMRQLEAVELDDDPDTRDERRAALADELDNQILPTIARLDPKDPTAQKVLASVKIHKSWRATDLETRKDLLTSAREDLVRLSDRNPADAATCDQILALDMMLELDDDAMTRAEAVLHEDPNAPQANYFLGATYMKRGDLAKAEPHLKKAYEHASTNPVVMNDYAELLRLRGDLDTADRIARECVKASRLPEARDTLALVLVARYDSTKQREFLLEAETLLKPLAAAAHPDVRFVISYARVLAKLGKSEEASDCLARIKGAIDKAPADSPVRKLYEEAQEEVFGY